MILLHCAEVLNDIVILLRREMYFSCSVRSGADGVTSHELVVELCQLEFIPTALTLCSFSSITVT